MHDGHACRPPWASNAEGLRGPGSRPAAPTLATASHPLLHGKGWAEALALEARTPRSASRPQ